MESVSSGVWVLVSGTQILGMDPLFELQKLISRSLSHGRYALGWRGGAWYTNRRIQREQLRKMGQTKPRRWKLQLPSRPLIQPLLKFRASRTNLKTANSSPAPTSSPVSSSENITT